VIDRLLAAGSDLLDLCFSDSCTADQYNIHFGGFLLLLLLKFHNCAAGPAAALYDLYSSAARRAAAAAPAARGLRWHRAYRRLA
jgi:hypothetical protein